MKTIALPKGLGLCCTVLLLLPGVAFAQGTLSGTIVDAANGTTPIYPVAIDLLDPVTGEDPPGLGAINNPDGTYEITSIPAENYKIIFNAFGDANAYTDELYDGIPCDNGGCERDINGDVIAIVEGENTLDVDLDRGFLLSGTVTNQSAQPIDGVLIEIFDQAGSEVCCNGSSDGVGEWSMSVSQAGTYYARVANWQSQGYIPEIWDDIACDGCDPVATGTPIVVTDADYSGINYELQAAPRPAGTCGSGDVISVLGFEDVPAYSIEFLTDSFTVFGGSGQQAQFTVVFNDEQGQPMDVSTLEWCLADESLLEISVDGDTATVTSTGFDLTSVDLTVRDPVSTVSAQALVAFADLAADAGYIDSNVVFDNGEGGGDVILQRNAQTELIEIGDVIVSGNQAGLLVRVLGVTLTETQVILSFETAGLTDAFVNLSIDTSSGTQSGSASLPLGTGRVSGGNTSPPIRAGLNNDDLTCTEREGLIVEVLETGNVNWEISGRLLVQLEIAGSSLKVFSLRATQDLDLSTSGATLRYESSVGAQELDPVVCQRFLEPVLMPRVFIPGWTFRSSMDPRVGIQINNTLPVSTELERLSVPVGRLISTTMEGVRWTELAGWEKLGSVISEGTKTDAASNSEFRPIVVQPEGSGLDPYDVDVSVFGDIAFDIMATRIEEGAPLGSIASGQPESTTAQSPTGVRQRLEAEAANKGQTSVIVGLDIQFQPEARQSTTNVALQRAAIRSKQVDLLAQLPTAGVNLNAQYRFIPFMALSVDSNALQALYSSALVNSIQADHLSAPSMASSNPVIGSPTAWADGYEGTGLAVAVLDTGVDKTHPWFTTGGSKVVSEACYSKITADSFSVCPNFDQVSTAPGSGVDCTKNSDTTDECWHGTHVAGTVAGNDGSGPDYGVARGADLIAIQVFSEFDSEADCGAGMAPCLRSWSSDQILALERVLELRESISIAAVNMSLAGGQYFDQASCDAAHAAQKTAIDNLRAAGISTIIAAGNDDYRDSISAPGCISSAISVSATTDEDAVASFSNIYPDIHLLAPGVSITSSVPGTGTEIKQGTSMATPHVAGAWAVLQGAAPGASVAEILLALELTGVTVHDGRAGGIERDMRRIDIPAALDYLLREPEQGLTASLVFHAEFYGREHASDAPEYTGPKWRLETQVESGLIPTFNLALQPFLQAENLPEIDVTGAMFSHEPIDLAHSPALVPDLTCIPQSTAPCGPVSNQNEEHSVQLDLSVGSDSSGILRYLARHSNFPMPALGFLTSTILIDGESSTRWYPINAPLWPDGVVEIFPRLVINEEQMNGPMGEYPYASESPWKTFTMGPDEWILTVEKLGDGEGTVTSRTDSGGGGAIDCGETCSASFQPGSEIHLTAMAEGNSEFIRWDESGECPGLPVPDGCPITMDDNKTAKPIFERRNYTFEIAYYRPQFVNLTTVEEVGPGGSLTVFNGMNYMVGLKLDGEHVETNSGFDYWTYRFPQAVFGLADEDINNYQVELFDATNNRDVAIPVNLTISNLAYRNIVNRTFTIMDSGGGGFLDGTTVTFVEYAEGVESGTTSVTVPPYDSVPETTYEGVWNMEPNSSAHAYSHFNCADGEHDVEISGLALPSDPIPGVLAIPSVFQINEGHVMFFPINHFCAESTRVVHGDH